MQNRCRRSCRIGKNRTNRSYHPLFLKIRLKSTNYHQRHCYNGRCQTRPKNVKRLSGGRTDHRRGDNLTLTFSPALVDFFIYVIDVAAGDKIPRKDGPGISYSDILVINKTDLAPYVHADLEVMRRDSELMRPGKPFVFTNCMTGEGIKELVALIRNMALFDRVSEKAVEEMKL